MLFFVLGLSAGTVYLQRDNPNGPASLLGGMVAALLLGFILPKQILYRLVKSYRRKLQEALPDTVDLLGIVLGTGLGLDQAMMRVSEVSISGSVIFLSVTCRPRPALCPGPVR